METFNTAGEPDIFLRLRKNGEPLADTACLSRNTGAGEVSEMGGRTMILHLDRGESFDLFCDDCTAGIYHTSFCVTLTQFDVV